MSSQERPFLDFYGRHSIIPTELVVPDEKIFFKHRDFLFQSLGIPPQLLRGKTIFELGPGNGQKLKHLLSLGPASYTAVDGNPSSIAATRLILKETDFVGELDLIQSNFLDYKSNQQFDLVLAELVVPTQHEPSLILRKLSQLVKDGGLIVVTCIDPVSMLSETLRKAIVIKKRMIKGNILESAKEIATFFRPDFASLNGMNRKTTDWALDQIIKPTVGKLLSTPNTLDLIPPTMEFLGSSPRFFRDFRWYKHPSSITDSNLELVKIDYWKNLVLFLDMRLSSDDNKSSLGQEIYSLAEEIFLMTNQIKFSDSELAAFGAKIHELELQISDVSPMTNESIRSFISFWDSGNPKQLKDFRPWWGRGTQYLSFIKDRI